MSRAVHCMWHGQQLSAAQRFSLLQSRVFTNFERLGAGSVAWTVDRHPSWRKHRRAQLVGDMREGEEHQRLPKRSLAVTTMLASPTITLSD